MSPKKPSTDISKEQEFTLQKDLPAISSQEGELFPEASFRACLLVIGNEILAGRTQDLNVQFLGETLSRHGIDLKEVRILPDEEKVIIDHLKNVKGLYDYVFTTGGIGPTHDDLTTECIAQALNVPVIEDEEALKRLKGYYKDNLSEANRKMARVPFGSQLIENPVTTAPGFFIENIYVLAGVPRIMRGMVMSLLPFLKGGAPILSQSISCALAESLLAQDLKKIQDRYPSFGIGIYPFFRPEGYGTTIVVRGKNIKVIERIIAKVKGIIILHGGVPESDVSLLFKDVPSSKSFFRDALEGPSFFQEILKKGKSYGEFFVKGKYKIGASALGGLILLGIGIILLNIKTPPSPQYVQKPFFEKSNVLENNLDNKALGIAQRGHRNS